MQMLDLVLHWHSSYVAPFRGCVHGVDAALWGVAGADRANTDVSGEDAVVNEVTGTDESC